MDDLNAFERQLARDAQSDVGPARPVDDAAIFAAITATPSPKWRFQPMLTATKAIAAGALLFVVGGALLIAQPFDQTQRPAPAAEADRESTGAAWVTGTVRADMGSNQPLRGSANCRPPERVIEEDVVHEIGYRCATQVWTTDDPRLSGTVTASWSADVYRLSPSVSVMSSSVREVVNEGGTWRCTSAPTVGLGTGLDVIDDVANPETFTCVGTGDHEGLTAVLDVDDGEVDADGSVVGLIFSGEVPAPPEPSTE